MPLFGNRRLIIVNQSGSPAKVMCTKQKESDQLDEVDANVAGLDIEVGLGVKMKDGEKNYEDPTTGNAVEDMLLGGGFVTVGHGDIYKLNVKGELTIVVDKTIVCHKQDVDSSFGLLITPMLTTTQFERKLAKQLRHKGNRYVQNLINQRSIQEDSPDCTADDDDDTGDVIPEVFLHLVIDEEDSMFESDEGEG